MRNRISKRSKTIAAIFLLFTLLAVPALALAHPMGDFAISRYSRLELGDELITLVYVVDMAEIPTFQEREIIDSNRDGEVDSAESTAYLAQQVTTIAANLDLRVGGESAEWTLQDNAISFPEGDGGLLTTRIELSFTAPLAAAAAPWSVEFNDNNFSDRLGWQEVVIAAGSDIVLLDSTAPTEDLTDELRNYPSDAMLENTDAEFTFEPLGMSNATQSVTVSALGDSSSGISLTGQEDRFAELINEQLTSPLSILLVALLALGWGAAHAFTPGHGKTLVAAYLVGSRGTVSHALFLGLTTTVTHTLGVFALGFITLFLSRYILPEQLFPWLGVASGLLVIGIGWQLMRGRFASAVRPEKVAIAGHDHTEVEFIEGEGFMHSHGGSAAHSHMPMTSDSGISWGSLFALGVSGGLIPCPSALVLMLSAIALERVGYGMVLIVIFSIGLAGVLTGIGILWVKARDIVERYSSEDSIFARYPIFGHAVRFLPAFSAAFITIIGIIITFQAIMQTGII
ncbi:MAG: high-affinity nickel-transporter [Anaerolineae bacterium]|nr:high-affinity nickel-transporter [Anaerolineae bacterium]